MSCDSCGAEDQPGRFCYGCGVKMPPRPARAVRVRSRRTDVDRPAPHTGGR